MHCFKKFNLPGEDYNTGLESLEGLVARDYLSIISKLFIRQQKFHKLLNPLNFLNPPKPIYNEHSKNSLG